MLAAEKRQYKAGRAARERGDGASACPFGLNQMRLRSLWLAGWHDADMEVGNGWYEIIDYAHEHTNYTLEKGNKPTRWLPLPPPPTEQ